MAWRNENMNEFKMKEYGRLLNYKKMVYRYNKKKVKVFFVTNNNEILIQLRHKNFRREIFNLLSYWDNISEFVKDIKDLVKDFVEEVEEKQRQEISDKEKEKQLKKEFDIKPVSDDALSTEYYIASNMVSRLKTKEDE